MNRSHAKKNTILYGTPILGQINFNKTTHNATILFPLATISLKKKHTKYTSKTSYNIVFRKFAHLFCME